MGNLCWLPILSFYTVCYYLTFKLFLGIRGNKIAANKTATSNTTNIVLGFNLLLIFNIFQEEQLIFFCCNAAKNMPYPKIFFFVKNGQIRKSVIIEVD